MFAVIDFLSAKRLEGSYYTEDLDRDGLLSAYYLCFKWLRSTKGQKRGSMPLLTGDDDPDIVTNAHVLSSIQRSPCTIDEANITA